MTASTLSKVMGGRCSKARYAELVGPNNQAMVEAGCTTVNRAAMWLGQIRQESGGLEWFTELASGREYEGRSDLGNTHPGDGVRFKGRGPIQVTGRANYTALSRWAHAKGYVPTATYLVDNPTNLAEDRYGFLGAVWFWETHGINGYADRGDVRGATLRINGGTNGLASRLSYYNFAHSLGIAILPSTPKVGSKQYHGKLKTTRAVHAYRPTFPGSRYGKIVKTIKKGEVHDGYITHRFSDGRYFRIGKAPNRLWLPMDPDNFIHPYTGKKA